MTHDARHKKTDLKVFVFVIIKEGWARVANFSRIWSMISAVSNSEKSVSYQKKGPSFFWYDNDKDL